LTPAVAAAPQISSIVSSATYQSGSYAANSWVTMFGTNLSTTSHSNVNLPFPFPDALQEFSVETGGLSARSGLQAGALVNVVTKSGTNQFHGTLFEFVRNGNFNARNSFAATQDSLRRNQFGGVIGGPIKKDRVFFFAGYQGTRERTAPPQSLAFVPTQATLNGDFSGLASAACQSSGVARSILNPVTRTPFPDNQIPTVRFSAPAVALLKYLPTSPDPCGRLTYAIPNPNNENQIVTRGDWQQSSKHSIFGRYFVADFSNPPLFDGNLLNTTRAGLKMRSQAAVIGSFYLRNLAAVTPDGRLFPDFDDNLRQAMRRETELLFESIVREDRNVLDLIGADYTFLNERLAKHYGVPDVYGARFRRVTFPPGDHRGGLLGQGSILTVTSYATRTSPVLRGKWILANLLGTAPPPPPPNVPSLKENIDTFNGPGGLRQALLSRPEIFVGTLTEKLLTYALGRGLETYDTPAVRGVVHGSGTQDYRFSALVLGVANSTPFQMRRTQ